jgi:enoyl-CoA hydratase/carnithine racemase
VSFWIPELDLGIPLTWGAVPLLVREIGMARAREAVVLCDRIDAETALSWGLLHRLVPADSLDEAVTALAERLAAKPELAMSLTNAQLRAYGAVPSLGVVGELDGDLLGLGSASREFRDGFRMK